MSDKPLTAYNIMMDKQLIGNNNNNNSYTNNSNKNPANREAYFELINERVALFFSGLELFRFRQASDIWGLSTDVPQSKRVFLDIASSFSLLAACESMYYSMAFLDDTSVDTMYQEVFNAFQTLLDLYEMDKEKYDEARSFCNLLEDLCCLLQVRTSMIMIYRALKASQIDEIDYDEFAAAVRSISKRPLKCTHRSLKRLRNNTSSEIELLCRLFEAQIAISNYQFKDATVRLYQCKTLYSVWKNSVERGAANLGILSGDGINNLGNGFDKQSDTFKGKKTVRRNSSSSDNLSRRNRALSLTSSSSTKSIGFRFWSGLSIVNKDKKNNNGNHNTTYNNNSGSNSSTSASKTNALTPRNGRGSGINGRSNISTRTSPRNSKKPGLDKTLFNLPPVFPWLQLYLNSCIAKSTLIFHGILTKSHVVEEYNKYSEGNKNLAAGEQSKRNTELETQTGYHHYNGNNSKHDQRNIAGIQNESTNTSSINSKEWNDVQDVLWNKKTGKQLSSPSNKSFTPTSSLDKKTSNSLSSYNTNNNNENSTPSVFDGIQNKNQNSGNRNYSKILQSANVNNRRLLPMPIDTNLTKDTALDFIGISLKMIKKCKDSYSSNVYIALALDVSALKDGYPFSLKTGYLCPDYTYANDSTQTKKKTQYEIQNRRSTTKFDGEDHVGAFTNLDLVVEGDEDDAFQNSPISNRKKNNHYQTNKGSDYNDEKKRERNEEEEEDEESYNTYKKDAKARQNRYKHYTKPQGMKSWPIIFSLPTSFAHSAFQERHWPNIVSLLIGGIPNLEGFKDPFFHHESRVGTSPTSYYIANIDENVSMVVIADMSKKNTNTGPMRPIIDFFRQVSPILRMEQVFNSLKPLKFS